MPDTNLTDLNPTGPAAADTRNPASYPADSYDAGSPNSASDPTAISSAVSDSAGSTDSGSSPANSASQSSDGSAPADSMLQSSGDSSPAQSPSQSNGSSASSEGSDYSGTLKISVVSSIGMVPVENATVSISYTGDPEAPLYVLTTDSSGQTPVISLPSPPLELSLQPENEQQPYSEYNIEITAENYEPVLISGSEIFADEFSLQSVQMNPLAASNEDTKVVIIPAHTLFGNFPPKIPEDEIKPMAETGEIVLSRVVIPEYVIVHDGVPSDSTVANYWVRYKDYIKNVASCEIYSTWPESAIYANILAIQSFTLNRVYTEW